jgi:HEAT repeat protein
MSRFSPDIQELVNNIRGNSYRRAAFDTLKASDSAESTAALLELVADYRVPPFYAEALHELGLRCQLDPMEHFRDILLTDSAESNHTGNQLTVIAMLSEYSDREETIALLTHTLKHHDNRYILRQCVFTLGQIATDHAVYVLSLLMLQHPESRVQHDAVMVLGSTRNPRAATVLLNYLEQDNLMEDGRPSTNCVNAMNSLLRLWKAKVYPFNMTRWLDILTCWLYYDMGDYPNALYSLSSIKHPESETIIETWQHWREAQNHVRLFTGG